MMINALNEFVDHFRKLDSPIKCARIEYHPHFEVDKLIILPVNFTQKQLVDFFHSLNFEYNNGYGTQHIYGTIWYYDGTWSSRDEYDGSESWRHNCVPPIPNELTNGSVSSTS
jgi:hypothetical protein